MILYPNQGGVALSESSFIEAGAFPVFQVAIFTEWFRTAAFSSSIARKPIISPVGLTLSFSFPQNDVTFHTLVADTAIRTGSFSCDEKRDPYACRVANPTQEVCFWSDKGVEG